jgi:hypothetical protein
MNLLLPDITPGFEFRHIFIFSIDRKHAFPNYDKNYLIKHSGVIAYFHLF